MTDTDRMVAWLREAMDAAQAGAEAATPGPWTVRTLGRHDQAAIVQDTGERTAAGFAPGPAFIDTSGTRATADARHVARHHPAAVLRRIAADRKLLELHPSTTEIINPGYGKPIADFGCVTCHDWDGVTEGYGYCPTVRALAEGYGWDEEDT